MTPVFFAPTDVRSASSFLLGGSGGGAVRASGRGESGGVVLGAKLRGRKTAPASPIPSWAIPSGEVFCSMRAQSPCSSREGFAVCWTVEQLRGFCGRHIERLHALQASRRAA